MANALLPAAGVPPAQLPEPLRGFHLRITSHNLGEDWHDETKGTLLRTFEYEYRGPDGEALRDEDAKGKIVRKWLEIEPDKVPIVRYTYNASEF